VIKRIKAHANYTQALGEQLGIVGPSRGAVTALAMTSKASADDKPVLKTTVTGDGTVVIKFGKGGHTGVLLYGRRAGESEFSLLSKQFRSPYIDSRKSLASSEPEMREYLAQFFEGDDAVGQLSDTTAVTIPAVRTQPVIAVSATTAVPKAA
jgi:hypothetical protein